MKRAQSIFVRRSMTGTDRRSPNGTIVVRCDTFNRLIGVPMPATSVTRTQQRVAGFLSPKTW